MRSVILRKFLSLEVGVPGIVLVLAYLVLSEITLAVQNDRPAIKKRRVVAESLTLSGPKRAGTARLSLSTGAELSFLRFASPDGVDNLKVVLVRGDPVVVLWDEKRKLSLFMNTTQQGSLLALNHDDDAKRMLRIFCGLGTSRLLMRERGGGVGFLVSESIPHPLPISTSSRRRRTPVTYHCMWIGKSWASLSRIPPASDECRCNSCRGAISPD